LVFRWAQFRTTKVAITLHTLLDLRGAIPTIALDTDGKIHQVTVLDELVIKLGAFNLLDRSIWLLVPRWRCISAAPFSRPVPSATPSSSAGTPAPWIAPSPLCSAISPDADRVYVAPRVFRPAASRGSRSRGWQTPHRSNEQLCPHVGIDRRSLPPTLAGGVGLLVDMQHLRITKCLETSENAVTTQIWIAISTCVLVAIAQNAYVLRGIACTKV